MDEEVVHPGTTPDPSASGREDAPTPELIRWEQSEMTKWIDAYAAAKNVKVRCLIANHPNGSKEYVLAEGDEAIYAASSLESIGSHIDRMYAAIIFGGEAVHSQTPDDSPRDEP